MENAVLAVSIFGAFVEEDKTCGSNIEICS